MRRSKKWVLGVLIICLAALAGIVLMRHRSEVAQRVLQMDIPVAVLVSHPVNEAPIVKPIGEPTRVFVEPGPDRFNLAVPFTSQAPFQDWSLPYQETCEEAAVLMAAAYLLPDEVSLKTPTDADRLLRDLVELQTMILGFYQDTTAEETVRFALAKFPSLRVTLKENPTAEEIRAEVLAGHPVLLPTAGKKLGNPNFQNGGPLYHMLLVRGFAPGRFVTNDPGTRKGEGYVYRVDTLMEAMGDWNGGHPETGKKVMLVFSL